MTANPRRDAWSAIRGFYYQIQLTVQRWLELSAADELFCERGEDNEVIRAALGGAPTPEQILEQVKVRDAVSLRSVEIVTALIRYFEARQAGARPTLFRFITTARAAKEQGAAFPRDLEGLLSLRASRRPNRHSPLVWRWPRRRQAPVQHRMSGLHRSPRLVVLRPDTPSSYRSSPERKWRSASRRPGSAALRGWSRCHRRSEMRSSSGPVSCSTPLGFSRL